MNKMKKKKQKPLQLLDHLGVDDAPIWRHAESSFSPK